MKKVYAVSSGSYSDYRVHAIFEDEATAEAWAKDTPEDLAGPQECPHCKQKTAYLDEPEDDERDVDVIFGYRETKKVIGGRRGAFRKKRSLH